ncbi:MAG: hypothetical protein MJB14_15490 [Spirochaetes bacterium]|nr:hypothetical protein [Spirochaetota bacterium]
MSINHSNHNRILKSLISGRNISEKQLKKIYHYLCLQTHPDLTGKDGKEFIEIQKEYQQACMYFNKLKDFVKEGEIDPSRLKNPRHELLLNLYHYTIAGLHSVKIRMKPELKSRNAKIIKSILFWAKWYDKNFITIFIDYNKPQFKCFKQWQSEKEHKVIRKQFLYSLYHFFQYQKTGSQSKYEAAKINLCDTLDMIQINSKNSLITLERMVNWFLKEIEFSPLYF